MITRAVSQGACKIVHTWRGSAHLVDAEFAAKLGVLRSDMWHEACRSAPSMSSWNAFFLALLTFQVGCTCESPSRAADAGRADAPSIVDGSPAGEANRERLIVGLFSTGDVSRNWNGALD